MKKKSILFALAAVCLPVVLSAQQERKITLNEAIAMARVQSVDAAVALNELKTAYWEYRTFRADLLPEVNLTGTLPNYNKSYGSYQNADGSYSFVRNSALGLSGDLSIDQNIWLTGGKLSLVSSLDYMKQLGSGGDRHFMSVPITLKLTQPILGVNNVKWNRRIEPVRYAEAKAAFITATEEVTMRAITYYFNLLLAEENLGTARQNLSNADHLYKVALAKREMGQISENELLQLKLSALNAKASLTEAESDLNAKMFQLRAFLGVGEDENLRPVIPETVDGTKMEYNQVLSKALERNSFAQNIRRRQLIMKWPQHAVTCVASICLQVWGIPERIVISLLFTRICRITKLCRSVLRFLFWTGENAGVKFGLPRATVKWCFPESVRNR